MIEVAETFVSKEKPNTAIWVTLMALVRVLKTKVFVGILPPMKTALIQIVPSMATDIGQQNIGRNID